MPTIRELSARPPGKPGSRSTSLIRSSAARFTSRTAAQRASSRLARSLSRVMPALWTTAQIRVSAPCLVTTWPAILAPASGRVMSSWRALPPISLATLASASPDAGTSTATTVAPSRANVRAMAAPMPRAAPVTTTTRPVKGCSRSGVPPTGSPGLRGATVIVWPATKAERPSRRNRRDAARSSAEVPASSRSRFEVDPPRSSLPTVRLMPSSAWATALASRPSTADAAIPTMMMRPDLSRPFIAGRSSARTPSRWVISRTPVASITSAPRLSW